MVQEQCRLFGCDFFEGLFGQVVAEMPEVAGLLFPGPRIAFRDQPLAGLPRQVSGETVDAAGVYDLPAKPDSPALRALLLRLTILARWS